MMVLWVWVITARPIHEGAFDHVPHASQLWMVHVYYATVPFTIAEGGVRGDKLMFETLALHLGMCYVRIQ